MEKQTQAFKLKKYVLSEKISDFQKLLEQAHLDLEQAETEIEIDNIKHNIADASNTLFPNDIEKSKQR